MKVYFKITDIVYEITGDIPKYVGPELTEYLFQEEPEGKYKLYVELKSVDEFTPFACNPIYQGQGYLILRSEEGSQGWMDPEHRIYMLKGTNHPTAVYKEMCNIKTVLEESTSHKFEKKESPDIIIEYLSNENPVMNMTFMEFFSIDRHLACEDAFIMHSCYVEHDGEAIIFTAPSGTGKSTQGSLWTQYANARIINGDRCILKLEGNTCQAYGLPFCGSSSINHNHSCPVKAIVFLAQGPENVIDDKPSLYLLKKLMSQTTYSAWAPEAMAQVMDIYNQFFQNIAIIQYACTPDQEAVHTLWEYLKLRNNN